MSDLNDPLPHQEILNSRFKSISNVSFPKIEENDSDLSTKKVVRGI